MKKVFAAALVSSLLLLAGCNTVAGFGQDMSAVGHSIANAASK